MRRNLFSSVGLFTLHSPILCHNQQSGVILLDVNKVIHLIGEHCHNKTNRNV
jgi:hypothetical protein